MIKIAYPTDEHVPYQDDRARSVALQIVADFEPDIRICGSDGMDFYSLSVFSKNPKRVSTLQVEIDTWQRTQREWRDAAPGAKAFYIRGNHEDRLVNYLWRHPELYDLEIMKLPNLLNFPSLDIIWEQEKGDQANLELVLYNKLVITHGEVVRSHSAYTARGEMEKENYSISKMTGHTHRGGSHFARTRNGIVQGHECFCLCSLEPEYVRRPNWQQGIVLATVSQEALTVESVPFHRRNGLVKAIWRGKEYTE